MNCRTLEYIVAVKEKGSVQLAAKYCNVTAGTISGQITRLEKYLGTTIFVSRSDPAVLNPNAVEIYKLMSDIVKKMKKIKQLARG